MQNRHSSGLSVAGLALGFAVGALVLYVMTWLAGVVSHGGWMMGGGMMMGSWGIGAGVVFIICAAIIGAIVALAHNAVAK